MLQETHIFIYLFYLVRGCFVTNVQRYIDKTHTYKINAVLLRHRSGSGRRAAPAMVGRLVTFWTWSLMSVFAIWPDGQLIPVWALHPQM